MRTRVILTLMRKHLLESRWSLGLTSAIFFGLAVLLTWRVQVIEELIASADVSGFQRRGIGFLRFLGGPEMDFSTTALVACWWNHPFFVLPIVGWAVARGAAAVAGEIERGTIDVTLSRPVSRSDYLLSQIIFALAGLAVLIAALIAGFMFGQLFFTLKAPPSVFTLLKPGAMVFTLGMAIFGYTLPFSALDASRWRPAMVSCAITLGGLIAMSLAPQFPDYEWIENLSVFQYYGPVTVAMKGESLGYFTGVLSMVFAVGVAASFWAFLRRDLPSNS